MSAASSAPGLLRTYGKKSAMKRKQARESLDPADEPCRMTGPAKRQKLSPELRIRTPSPTRTEDAIDSGYKKMTLLDNNGAAARGFPRKQNPIPQSSSKTAPDFSTIFDDISTKSPSGSPSKLSKRMLSRSKTESSIEGSVTSQTSALDRTPSLPMFPTTPSRDTESVASTSKASAPLLPRLTQGSNKSVTRTYAGGFRSFLVSLPKSSVPNGSIPTTEDDDELETRESYSSLRSRWGVDNSEDDPYPLFSPSPSKSNKSNATTPDVSPSRNGKGKAKAASARPLPIPSGMSLKSISELRNRGESRRFLDEVGYLFEGMNKKGGIGLRRASALEITTKLCDDDFARKAKAADFFARTWDVFIDAGAGQGEDKILDILLVFFLALVARDPSSLAELAQRPPGRRAASPNLFKDESEDISLDRLSFIDTLFRLMETILPDFDPLMLVAPDRSTGDADLKKAGISRKDRPFLTTVYRAIKSKAAIFAPDVLISTSLLIGYILQSLPPFLIQPSHFPTFLHSLQRTISPSPPATLTSTLSSEWRDSAVCLPYDNIYHHLSLLDTFLLDQWEPPPASEGSQSQSQPQGGREYKERNQGELDHARDKWLAEDLLALCVCLELSEQSDDLDPATLQKCLGAVLRILVSLTHEDELWGRKIAQGEYTMPWLLRLIHRTGQEVLQNRLQVKEEDIEVKVEEGEEGISSDHDSAIQGQTDSQALDTLCLALGLLTNLVQVVEQAKTLISHIRVNPSCTLRKQSCARRCNCSSASSGIEILVQLYSQQQVKVEESTPSLSADSPQARLEADAAFLRSHLAVLFGLLMKGVPENEAAIIRALPLSSGAKNSKTTERLKFTRLVEQAKDFAAFYSAVSRNLGGDKESKVAKDVVDFLELKRDSIL